jgi:hypothetical protein
MEFSQQDNYYCQRFKVYLLSPQFNVPLGINGLYRIRFDFYILTSNLPSNILTPVEPKVEAHRTEVRRRRERWVITKFCVFFMLFLIFITKIMKEGYGFLITYGPLRPRTEGSTRALPSVQKA